MAGKASVVCAFAGTSGEERHRGMPWIRRAVRAKARFDSRTAQAGVGVSDC